MYISQHVRVLATIAREKGWNTWIYMNSARGTSWATGSLSKIHGCTLYGWNNYHLQAWCTESLNMWKRNLSLTSWKTDTNTLVGGIYLHAALRLPRLDPFVQQIPTERLDGQELSGWMPTLSSLCTHTWHSCVKHQSESLEQWKIVHVYIIMFRYVVFSFMFVHTPVHMYTYTLKYRMPTHARMIELMLVNQSLYICITIVDAVWLIYLHISCIYIYWYNLV